MYELAVFSFHQSQFTMKFSVVHGHYVHGRGEYDILSAIKLAMIRLDPPIAAKSSIYW